MYGSYKPSPTIITRVAVCSAVCEQCAAIQTTMHTSLTTVGLALYHKPRIVPDTLKCLLYHLGDGIGPFQSSAGARKKGPHLVWMVLG